MNRDLLQPEVIAANVRAALAEDIGSGDITARTPDDEKLHGVSERLFSKTGNGGVEETALRGRVAAWLASQMGVPSLSGKYQFFYINGSSFANLVEDQEEPDHRYAEHHQPDNVDGDLYKISIWFEHDNSNSQFNSIQATMERFLSGGQLKLARYRWNWERRAQVFPESNYQTIFDLVTALNSTADAGFVSRVLQQADMDQWMHVFAFHRVTGNWDSWTYNVGQNMYIYRQPGRKAVLFPWDIDFVLGLQLPGGEIGWARSSSGVLPEALLTGCASVYHSIRCALALADHLDRPQPEWEVAVGALGHAIVAHPEEDTPRLMFADWLDEQGDGFFAAWASLVRAQVGERLDRVLRVEEVRLRGLRLPVPYGRLRAITRRQATGGGSSHASHERARQRAPPR